MCYSTNADGSLNMLVLCVCWVQRAYRYNIKVHGFRAGVCDLELKLRVIVCRSFHTVHKVSFEIRSGLPMVPCYALILGFHCEL